MVNLRIFSGQNVIETTNVELKSKIIDLKSLAASKISGEIPDNFDIFFCGRKFFDDDSNLENLSNVNENSTIFAFKKPKIFLNQLSPPNAEELDTLLSSLQATLVDPHHRALLNRIAGNPETLQNLIDCVPGLRQDTVAQAVLKDPYLLLHWVDDENSIQNFTKHPCLFSACQHIVEHLHAEVMRSSGASADAPFFPPPPPDVAVGDPFMSDDDEDEDGDNGQPRVPNNYAARNRAARIPITTQNLAAALAAAAGLAGPSVQPQMPPPSSTGRPVPSSPSSNSQRLITADIFRQAVQQALQPLPNLYEEQMADLRNMGFTNDEENLRALRVSNGEVQAALEFIINQRERQEEGFGLD